MKMNACSVFLFIVYSILDASRHCRAGAPEGLGHISIVSLVFARMAFRGARLGAVVDVETGNGMSVWKGKVGA